MKQQQLNSTPICIGAGLVALDVVITQAQNTTRFYAGGSCGNVLTILSFLGWKSYPIARLSNNVAADLILEDLTKWQVKDNLMTFSEDGSTPIIIHRILRDNNGVARHKFEFRNPEDGSYLPSYKPCLAKSVQNTIDKSPIPTIFYFDRINRSSINLAREYKSFGATTFFEPSSMKDLKGFKECLEIAEVVKFSDERIPNFSEVFPVAIAPLEIQTLGNKGLMYRKQNESKWRFVGSFTIDNLIDTAGAGDWCTSGIIYSLNILHKPLHKVNKGDLIQALKFGQALGALNCTFEGARGLMYHINSRDLLLLVDHIVASDLQNISTRNRFLEEEKPKGNQTYKISSLFAHHYQVRQ